MARLLFITDYTEQFAYRLLKGIINYSETTGSEKWVVYRMPSSYRRKFGMKGILNWALKWKADVVVGQFDPEDDVSVFRENGIVAFAQDYIAKFDSIPNITADYHLTGTMAAEHFLVRGFHNFAFFGYNGVCWSNERYEGFRSRVNRAGYEVLMYDCQNIDDLWYYNPGNLSKWLLNLPKPVAIMACDDNQGNLLLNVCNSCGIRIPDEVAVIGVDNDEILDNLSDPTLTSIDVDIERGGYEVAQMALRMMRDPSYKPSDIYLRPVSVITRMSTSVFATKDKEIVTALQYISRNVDRRIFVPDILKEVPLSRRLLEMRFKKVTGNTIYNYISRQRIERFAYYLLHSTDTIAEISAKMAEPDPKSLCRRFKAIKGCTPSEYREQESHKSKIK